MLLQGFRRTVIASQDQADALGQRGKALRGIERHENLIVLLPAGANDGRNPAGLFGSLVPQEHRIACVNTKLGRDLRP